MSRPPPAPAVLARLARLQALAKIRAEAEIARLATTAQTRARLQAALDVLGQPEPPLGPDPAAGAPLDPALIRARLAHAGWIAGQRRELNARLAMVQADWHRLRPGAARAFGRARVLGALHDELAARPRPDRD